MASADRVSSVKGLQALPISATSALRASMAVAILGSLVLEKKAVLSQV